MLGTSLSIKGQVTIPKEIREALDLEAGDRVAFIAEKDKAIMVPVKGDFLSLKGILAKRHKARQALSPEVMTKMAKRHVVRRYHAHRS